MSKQSVSDLTRVMQKDYVPRDEYEQILRFLGWLNDFQYTRSKYQPWVRLSDRLLERIARTLAQTDKNPEQQ